MAVLVRVSQQVDIGGWAHERIWIQPLRQSVALEQNRLNATASHRIKGTHQECLGSKAGRRNCQTVGANSSANARWNRQPFGGQAAQNSREAVSSGVQRQGIPVHTVQRNCDLIYGTG